MIDINMHNVETITANTGVSGTSWLTIKDKHGNHIALFIEPHEAQALADVWGNKEPVR